VRTHGVAGGGGSTSAITPADRPGQCSSVNSIISCPPPKIFIDRGVGPHRHQRQPRRLDRSNGAERVKSSWSISDRLHALCPDEPNCGGPFQENEQGASRINGF